MFTNPGSRGGERRFDRKPYQLSSAFPFVFIASPPGGTGTFFGVDGADQYADIKIHTNNQYIESYMDEFGSGVGITLEGTPYVQIGMNSKNPAAPTYWLGNIFAINIRDNAGVMKSLGAVDCYVTDKTAGAVSGTMEFYNYQQGFAHQFIRGDGITTSTMSSTPGLNTDPPYPPVRAFNIFDFNANNNAVAYALRLNHNTSGTPATGIGVGMEFEVETSPANYEIGATIEAITTDITVASEYFDLIFKTMAAGAAAIERFRISEGVAYSKGLGANALVSTGNTTIPANYGSYIPEEYEIGSGFATEVGNGGILEIG